MRGDGFSRSCPISVTLVCAVLACTGPDFSSERVGDGGEAGSNGGEGAEDGSGGRGGSSARGGSAGVANGGTADGGTTSGGTATNGGAATGGTATGGATAPGGSTASGGDVSGGATATGGSSRGGALQGGSGGAGSGGAGSAGAAGAGANGGGGASGECADALSCTVCCDELYPDAHGHVAGMFYNCGCGTPCYSYCLVEFCGSVYYWSDDCLACMLQAPQSNADCVNASAACDDSELCSAYRECIVGCS